MVMATPGGQLVTSYHCLECSRSSQGTTSFTDLTFAIPSTRHGGAVHAGPAQLAQHNQDQAPTDLESAEELPEDLYGDDQYQFDN